MGAERYSRLSQVFLNPGCDWVRAAEHAPRDPGRLLEYRHGLAEIVEHGVVTLKNPIFSTHKKQLSTLLSTRASDTVTEISRYHQDAVAAPL